MSPGGARSGSEEQSAEGEVFRVEEAGRPSGHRGCGSSPVGVEVWGCLPRCRLALEKSIRTCGPRHGVCGWVRHSGQGADREQQPRSFQGSGQSCSCKKALGVRLCRLEARPPEDVQGPFFRWPGLAVSAPALLLWQGSPQLLAGHQVRPR